MKIIFKVAIWVRNKVLLSSGVLFLLLSIYLAGHIGYWFYSNNEADKVVAESKGDKTPVKKQEEKVTVETMPFLKVDFDTLKKRNTDTVGWLRVGGVDIDLAVTQTVDNEYYLSHDFDKKPNKFGWVFADTRSNTEHLGTNTVLYGHNIINNNMFGSLQGLLNVNEKNLHEKEIIQFSTPTKQYVFEIVSMYVTEYDDWAYIQQQFGDDSYVRDFIERMQAKNTVPEYERGNLSVYDKFLTFSTCHGPVGTTKRLVVHARMIGEK